MPANEKPLLVLLPGLHGTDGLWFGLREVMPGEVDRMIVDYPADQPISYRELIKRIDAQVPRDRPLVLLGESFSGPLAVELACRRGAQMKLLILCATFVRPPWPSLILELYAISMFIKSWFFRWLSVLLPKWFWRTILGRLLFEANRVWPSTLAFRISEVAQVDRVEQLRRCSCPVLYLRGTRDVVVPPRNVSLIRAVRPDVRVEAMACSHFILQYCPGPAWGRIVEHLQRLGIKMS